MRPWFYDNNGNWVPVYDVNGMYHPDWLESEFTEIELRQFRRELDMFPADDKPTWKEYLNFKYNYYNNTPCAMPE